MDECEPSKYFCIRLWHIVTQRRFHKSLEQYGPGVMLYYKGACTAALFATLSRRAV
eukprot:SAG11_NODE_13594_length_648_cov_0.752277_1_plen_56_part_00